MSYAVSDWAWEQNCRTSAMQFVLVCLATYANKEGERAFPSVGTICRRTKLDERTVRKALAELVSAGFATKHDRKDEYGRQLSTEYRLILCEPTPTNMQEPNHPTPANMGEPFSWETGDRPPQICTSTPPNLGGNPVNELSKEESEGLRPSSRAPARRAQGQRDIPEDWQPSPKAIELGTSLGLDADRIALEADQMRDWAISSGKRGKDWDRRFCVWLRNEAKRDRSRPVRLQRDEQLSQHERIRREGNLPTHFGNHDDETVVPMRRAIA